jgi:hypothetical protein
MKVDFLKAACQTMTNQPRFGICDDEDTNVKTPAYINTADESRWIALVLNPQSKNLVLTAIDNCIEVLRENGDMDSRCDVMLTSDDSLCLIELKNKVSDWKASGIEQIEATLMRLIENHETYYFSFKKRKAYVANKRHPNFQILDNALMKRFSSQYKIWLDIQATIKI